ncbi:hypothetical protein EDB81DRAFT_812318 [Dactylonectria macrodidyma]|uniref:Secreted protein n=1 Tax=Dactylonectria macrodidyma TaxID=307937 RepID=A0A9P9IKY7_9HYPO|nr:hypothetical protein EDB81DRAFT_812318 [Dactylonectria macrodidyma]
MALCLLLKCLCGCSTFGVDSSMCLKVIQTLVSYYHYVCHLSLITLCDNSFNVDFKECSTGGYYALSPGGPLCLHPVASLAARSAVSLPYIPLWAGIYRILTVKPCVRSSCIRCVMS